MLRFIVTNVQGTKGIIQPAMNVDEARKLATDNYYSPFARKNDLNVIQVYEPNKHLFVSVNGNKTFKKVQYHTMGGVATNYDCPIDTHPTEDQIAFLGKPIEYVLFTNTEYK